MEKDILKLILSEYDKYNSTLIKNIDQCKVSLELCNVIYKFVNEKLDLLLKDDIDRKKIETICETIRKYFLGQIRLLETVSIEYVAQHKLLNDLMRRLKEINKGKIKEKNKKVAGKVKDGEIKNNE